MKEQLGAGYELFENDGSNHGSAQMWGFCFIFVFLFSQAKSELPLLRLLRKGPCNPRRLKKILFLITVFHYILVASVISNTLSSGHWSFKNLSQGNFFLHEIQTGTAQEPGPQAYWPAGAPFLQGDLLLPHNSFPERYQNSWKAKCLFKAASPSGHFQVALLNTSIPPT